MVSDAARLEAEPEGEVHVIDKDDVVIAIAASLYASRATDDAVRAEPDIQALANEAWNLYHKLERAVGSSPHRHGDGGAAQIGRA